MVVAPRQGAVAAHGRDRLILVGEEARQHHGSAGDEDRRILYRKNQGLLWWQTKPPLDVLNVARCRMGAKPLLNEPRIAPRLGHEFVWRDGENNWRRTSSSRKSYGWKSRFVEYRRTSGRSARHQGTVSRR